MKKIYFTLVTIIFCINIHAQNSNNIFSEKIISIQSKGCLLEGTLLSSSINNSKKKIAIIIAGSGPTDRNGNSIAGVFANSYKMLAEELAKQNIATYRYDKRGIAKSAMKNFKESNLVFDDYVSDAKIIFDYIKDSLGFADIYFIGHSEGSLIGIIASQQKPLKGLISLSGAGRSIDVIVEEQLNTQQQPAKIIKEVTDIFSLLKNGQKPDSVPPYLYSLFRPGIQPYMISWLKHNPVDEMKKVNVPSLILQGTCDVQVKVDDAQNLHNANAKSIINIIPQMTHTLTNAGENCHDENNKTYKDATLPLNTQLVSDIVSFINEKN